MEDGHSFWNIHEEKATDTTVTSSYETTAQIWLQSARLEALH